MEQQANDYLERTNNGTSFSGSDTNIFFGAVLASALGSYAKQVAEKGKVFIIMGRVKPREALKMATSYTGNTYKNGEYLKASEEVRDFIDSLKHLPKS